MAKMKYYDESTGQWITLDAKDSDTIDGKHFTDIQSDAQTKATKALTDGKTYTDTEAAKKIDKTAINQPNGVAGLDNYGYLGADKVIDEVSQQPLSQSVADLSSHLLNQQIHVTQAKKTEWDAKATPTYVDNKIGILTNLQTTEKSNLVGAVNEVSKSMKDIAYLPSNFKEVNDIDDTASINRALSYVNSQGGGKVRVPYRSLKYVISKPLIIYSNTHLEFDKNAVIFLANNSNCRMLENANKSTQTNLIRSDKNIKISGGIWEGNGNNQTKWLADGGTCTGFLFSGVENLEISPTKMINTQTYAVWCCNVKNAKVHDIEVDQGDDALVSPHNQDGVHFQGPSENIYIGNSTIKSGDDLIAINADDVEQGIYSTHGDITNVTIENIIWNAAQTGIRLMSVNSLLDNVVIKNMQGTVRGFFLEISTYGLGAGNFGTINVDGSSVDWVNDGGSARKNFILIDGYSKEIALRNIDCPRSVNTAIDSAYTSVVKVNKKQGYPTHVDHLVIENLRGIPTTDYMELIYINLSYVGSLDIHNLKNFYNYNNTHGCIPLTIANSSVKNVNIINAECLNVNFGIARLWISSVDKFNIATSYFEGRNLSVVIDESNVENLERLSSGKLPTSIGALGRVGLSVINSQAKFSSIPNYGEWEQGDVVYNANPASQSNVGWICTSGGVSYPSWKASTQYKKYQKVNANGGLFICKVAGTSSTTVPGTWSGDSVDGSVTWTFVKAVNTAVFNSFGLIS